ADDAIDAVILNMLTGLEHMVNDRSSMHSRQTRVLGLRSRLWEPRFHLGNVVDRVNHIEYKYI
ncbi:MAG: hypothetical protein LC131_14350, partial [Anaerolineae bacterium]|nr:hypothetical protein [Anaerolineae bacterium]